LSAVDRIIAIGSDGMMAAVAEARQAGLKRYFRPDHRAIASIFAPCAAACHRTASRKSSPSSGSIAA
jgi:hypothetical protein